jgi:hypothetical protein
LRASRESNDHSVCTLDETVGIPHAGLRTQEDPVLKIDCENGGARHGVTPTRPTSPRRFRSLMAWRRIGTDADGKPL